MTNPLKLRRAAAERLPGGDPWSGEHLEVPMTDHQAAAWHAAVEHLERMGCLAMAPMNVRRELWRRGGSDRRLSLSLRCAGVADD